MQSFFVTNIKPTVVNTRPPPVNIKPRMVAAHGFGSIKFSKEIADGRLSEHRFNFKDSNR